HRLLALLRTDARRPADGGQLLLAPGFLFEMVFEHPSAGALFVTSREDQSNRLISGYRPESADQVFMAPQLSLVAFLEFIPLFRVVVVPLAQLGGGGYFFHPFG